MKRFHFLYILLILCSLTRAQAQTELKYGSPDDPSLPDWAKEMYKNNPDYLLMMDLYEAYYKTHPFIKNEHTQYYKRLLHDLKEDYDGVRFGFYTKAEADKISKRYRQLIQTSNYTNKTSWSCVGPIDFDKESKATGGTAGAAHCYTVEQSLSNPHVVYAGTATTGLWRSDDKGLHWHSVTFNQFFNKVYAIEIDPFNEEIVYFDGDGKLFKRFDDGTVTAIGDVTFQNYNHRSFRDIAINPADRDKIWALSFAGLFVSSDEGAHWQRKMQGEFQEIEFKPDDPKTLYTVRRFNDSTEFFKSTDGGETWLKKRNGWPNPADEDPPAENKRVEIAVTPADPDIVYAYATGKANGGTGLFGIYVSYDAGENWNFQCCGEQPGDTASTSNKNIAGYDSKGAKDGGQYYYDLSLAVSPTNQDSLFAAAIMMWYSDDGGQDFVCPSTWYGTHDSNYVHADIHDVKIYGKDIWIACDGGIFYSDDGCKHVHDRMTGISGTDFWGFGAGYTNSQVMVGGVYHNGTLYKYKDVYENGWVSILSGDGRFGDVAPHNENIIFPQWERFTAPQDRNTSIRYEETTVKLNHYTRYDFSDDLAGKMYWGHNTFVLRSYDLGTTVDTIFNFGKTTGYIMEAPSDSNVLVASIRIKYTEKAYLFRSEDRGETWTDITPPDSVLNGENVIPYSFDLDEHNAKIIYLARTPWFNWKKWKMPGYKVYRSTDGGNTWENLTTPTLDDVYITNLIHQKGTDGGIYLGTRKAVYYKNNQMNDWVLFNNGLPPYTRSTRLIINYYDNLLINASNHSVYVSQLYEPSQLQANFLVDNGHLFCARDTIGLYDHSVVKKNEASWKWIIPDAKYLSDSTAQNPKVVFNGSGTFPVTLIVGNQQKQTDTLTKMVKISSQNDCLPDSVAGYAINLPGESDDYVEIPPLNITTNKITFTVWMYSTQTQNKGVAIIFSRGGSLKPSGFNFHSNNELGYNWNGDFWWWDPPLTVPNNQWSHVAFVIKPDSVIMYMNGKRAATANQHVEVTFNQPVYIGKMRYSSSRQFKGMMDEVCIFDTCLTEKEIKDLMYRTITPEENPHLIHYYQFNNSAGPVIDRGKGLLHAKIKGNVSRVPSNTPIPYQSVSNGLWGDTAVWAPGQLPPVNPWSRVKINHHITLDSNQKVRYLEIAPNGQLTVQPGDTLMIDY